jgi:hypothetical protein
MTEAEWLCHPDPAGMLAFLGDRLSARQLRLFAVACARRIEHRTRHEASRRLLDAVEEYVDGRLTQRQLERRRRGPRDGSGDYACWACASRNASDAARGATHAASRAVAHAVYQETWDAAVEEAHRRGLPERFELGEEELEPTCEFLANEAAEAAAREERRAQAALLREVAGNPFRELDRAAPWWRDQTARLIAKTIYEDRDFTLLPVLADALEEAGCDAAEVLDHLRLPGEHLRGCWALNLVLQPGGPAARSAGAG